MTLSPNDQRRAEVSRRLSAFNLDTLAMPAVTPIPPVPEAFSADSDAADKLEELLPLALRKLKEVLEEPTDFDDPRMVALQLQATNQVLTTQLRVDEGHLRRRKMDVLPNLLAQIAKEEDRVRVATQVLLE